MKIKSFLKSWFINAIALAILAWVFNAIIISFAYQDFFLTTLALSLVLKLVKPLFDLVFLPINVLTLGLFKSLKTVAAFAILSYLIKYIQFQDFYFPGFTWNAIEIKSFSTSSLISLFIASLAFNLIRKIIRWLIKGGKK